MWKSLSLLMCLSGKKTAAPLRMAFSASLCNALFINVSPSGPSTTKIANISQILLPHLFILQQNITNTYQGIQTKQRKKPISNVLTVAEMCVEFLNSLYRVKRRLFAAGGGWKRCGSFFRCPFGLIGTLGLKWIGQHGKTVLHQLEKQNSCLYNLVLFTETKTCTTLC